MFDEIVDFILEIWELIKKIFVEVLNFFKNIISFFKQPERLKKIQENRDILATSVKENLDNGNYRIINCLFDEETNEIIDMETDAIGIEANNVDDETLEQFGEKDMIVLL